MQFTITKSGDDLEKLTGDAVKALTKANRQVGKEIGKVARTTVLDEVRSRRGSLRFGKSKTGARYKLGAKPKIVAGAVGTAVYLKAVPPGFWSIVEYGSVGHDIEPKVSRGGERHALYFDGLYSAHADHPGTRGYGFWSDTEPALDRAVFELVGDTFDVALKVNEFHG